MVHFCSANGLHFLAWTQGGPLSLAVLQSLSWKGLLLGPRVQNGAGAGSSLARCCLLIAGDTVFRIIPLYLIYRPANNIPYATLEEDLGKPLEPYCSREWDRATAPAAASSSEAMQKCQTFQHWLFLWTNGSFLVTDVAGARVCVYLCACVTACRGQGAGLVC